MSYEVKMDTQELRHAYAHTLEGMIESGLPVVDVVADFAYGMGQQELSQKYPEHFVNVGIAEANMASFAAGLAEEGMIPFIHCFGVFASRRMLDQAYISGAYAHLNVNVCGADPGFICGHNGGTHMAMDDVAIYRTIPNALIVEPTDEVMVKDVIPKVAAYPYLSYIRLSRKRAQRIYSDNETFELGKAKLLREGEQLTIITAGRCVSPVLQAAEKLSEQGVQARVLDMFTLKPIDQEAILRAARETGHIITVENASIIGGLGSAVCEVLADAQMPAKVFRIAKPDIFGEVGTVAELQQRYGLTAEQLESRIINQLRKWGCMK